MLLFAFDLTNLQSLKDLRVWYKQARVINTVCSVLFCLFICLFVCLFVVLCLLLVRVVCVCFCIGCVWVV